MDSFSKCEQSDGSIVYTNKGCNAIDRLLSFDVHHLQSFFAGKDGMGFDPLKVLFALLVIYFLIRLVRFFMTCLSKYHVADHEQMLSEKSLNTMRSLNDLPGSFVAEQAFARRSKKRSYRPYLWLILCMSFWFLIESSRGFPVERDFVLDIYNYVTGLHGN